MAGMYDWQSMIGYNTALGKGGGYPAAPAMAAPAMAAAPLDFSSLMSDTAVGAGAPAFDMAGLGGASGAPMGALGAGGGSGFGFNMPTAQLALGGLQAIGNLWGGIQAQKMAKKQFKFQKNMSLINLANQVKSYNTALADRARSRAVMESQSNETRDAYIANNSLSTTRNDNRKNAY